MLSPEIIWNLLTEPTALCILAASFLAAWPLGRWLASRFGSSPYTAALFVAAVGGVLALTMTTHGNPSPLLLPSRTLRFVARLADVTGLRSDLAGFGQNAERIANIIMFMPVGFFGALTCSRAWYAAAFGLALTVFVEAWQSVVGRGGEVGDVLHNTAGALLGTGLAAIVLRAPLVRRRLARTTN